METINDIVRKLRIGDLCAEDTSASRPAYINDFLTSYADRIEAAWKREREAGAAAAQICGEIGEMVGREATTEKSSAVGNAGTVRGIAQEMLNTSMQDITAESINEWATRLAAACEQSVTDCNQLGNAVAMREALEKIASMGEQIDYQLGSSEETVYVLKHERCLAHNISECARSALSAPPRNCDVGTAEEQIKRHRDFCNSNVCKCESSCKICFAKWSQMPYEKEGAN